MDIILEKLKKCYGSHVALDIDQYTLTGGEIVGLVGNNGAGKTTLFRLMLDLLKADEGHVCIGDIEVSRSEEWKEFTGAYLDESFLIDYLTPEEYFHFIGKICGLDAATVDERLSAYERFMNGEILGQKKFIRNLSVDEPFNFLDPSSQSALKHLLREYHQETGATILVSSHNLNHTVDISSHIILLEHGVIIRDLKNEEGNAEKELEAYFEIEQ